MVDDNTFNEKPEQSGELATPEAPAASGAAPVYSVRYLPESPRASRDAVRRRGGVLFGRDRMLVSAGAYNGVQQVEPAALAQILADNRLDVEEQAVEAEPKQAAVEAPKAPVAPTPGSLAVKPKGKPGPKPKAK